MKDLGERDEVDFILCVGDGRTDEAVFSLLHDNSTALTCTVGKKQTEGTVICKFRILFVAKYYVESVRDVEALLKQLAFSQEEETEC